MNFFLNFPLKISRRTYLFSVFVIASFLRVILNLNNQLAIGGDSKKFLLVADSILQGFGFAFGDGKPTAFLMPVYPFLLAGVRFCLGENIFYIQLVQAILGALSCLIIYFIAFDVFNKRVAEVSFLVMTFYYFLIKQCGIIYAETLYIFLLSLSMFFLIRIFKVPEKRNNYIFFGIFFALVILTNCNLILFPFLIGVLLLWSFKKRIVVKNILVMLTIFSLPILGWAVRNYIVFHELIILPNKGGAFFYSSWTPAGGKIFGIKTKDEVTRFGGELASEAERNSYYYKKGWEVIQANPKRALKQLILKNAYFWSIFDWETLGNGTYNFSTIFIMPFFIISFFYIKRSDFFYVMPFIILILYYVLLANIFMGLPRYRMQIEPFLIILAAFAMVSLYEKFRQKQVYLICTGLWLLINFLIFTQAPAAKNLVKSLAVRIGIWW